MEETAGSGGFKAKDMMNFKDMLKSDRSSHSEHQHQQTTEHHQDPVKTQKKNPTSTPKNSPTRKSRRR